MPVLTCAVEDLGGSSSTEKITIYVQVARAATNKANALIDGPPVIVRPVGGVYTTPNLDPGPAVFAHGKTIFRFTIPDVAGPVPLVPLLTVPFVPPPPPTWQTVADATYAPVFPDTGITYDGSGNVQTVTENGVTTTYTYNSDGTVATDTRAGVTRTYTYDGSGNLTGIAS